MKAVRRILFAVPLVLGLLVTTPGWAQTKPETSQTKTAASPEAPTQKTNTDAYVALLRRNVRQERTEIMGSMMALSAADAAKFWPIYSEYDEQLRKLNDQRVVNIKEYAQNYTNLTDDEADKLVRSAMAFQKQRQELLVGTYEKVKAALGGVTAARFAMVEHQIETLIDLQIISSLPIAGQAN